MTRLSLVLVLALAACTARPPTAPAEWDLSPDLQVRTLAPGIWVHTSWQTYGGVRVPSNGLLMRDGDGLLMIDTAWGEAVTDSLIDWAERELGLGITRAYSTHWHEDRLGGAAVLQRRGIPFYAHPLTVAEARAHDLPAPTPIAALAVGETASFGPVEVLYPGPGHTTDNTMVWVPSARLLVGGCAVKGAEAADLGNTADADVAAWPEAMRTAQAAYPDARWVLPGHGDPGGTELLEHTLALLGAM